MNYVKRVCRVCGKEYNACATPGRGAFRWQDVVCCREHWQVYHDRIIAAREAEKQADKKE